MRSKKLLILTLSLFCFHLAAQEKPAPVSTAAPATAAAADDKDVTEKPNGKRIRRHLSLIVGLSHDEEFLIPDRETVLKGRSEFFDIQRIKSTDFFRIIPKKVGTGIATLNDKKTGQILVEIRYDIRDDVDEKIMREVQALLGDIEGIEFKYVSNAANAASHFILIDGYVLLPKDLLRIAQVISNYDGKVKTLASLSPIAKQRIANFISNDVNNPEVKITAVGDFIKLEGQVNSKDEKDRIKSIVSLYIPDIVVDLAPTSNVNIIGRKTTNSKIDDLIVDLITIKKDDEKVEPPPKLIQVVAHFVKFSDGYSKNFNFNFSPALSANAATGGPSTSIADTARLLSNLLPKLSWAKFHGFAKVLDTASILVQDKKRGVISRRVSSKVLVPGVNGSMVPDPTNTDAVVRLTVTPTIKSERSGLIELPIQVETATPGKSDTTSTSVDTVISVRDRQSAAFGGIIRKDTDTKYGAPATPDAIITLQASKEYARNNSQFVVFVTPIIKSSASTGVEQVKKKFRLRD